MIGCAIGIVAGGPSGPLASGDFTNIATNNAADGVYTINGLTVLIGDIIDLDHGETTFDPVLDIDMGGIKTRDGVTRQLAINDPLLTQLLTDGFTILGTIFGGETSTGFSVSVHDNEFTMDAGGNTHIDLIDPEGPVISAGTSVTDKDFNGPPTDHDQYPPFGQISKFALTVAADRVSASVYGHAIITQAGSGLDSAMANLVLSISGDNATRLRSFAFYEPLDDADLPTLSALS